MPEPRHKHVEVSLKLKLCFYGDGQTLEFADGCVGAMMDEIGSTQWAWGDLAEVETVEPLRPAAPCDACGEEADGDGAAVEMPAL